MSNSVTLEEKVKPLHIKHIMEQIGLTDDDFEYYGKFTGKIRLEVMEKMKDKPDGKLIIVTAITPTPSGEGKTLTSIGLSQALNKIGKKSIVTLREPSLGPVFGIKGGATGGGKSQVIPSELINLHFNGDIHAVASAHNLLAALIDAHIHHGNELRIDVNNITWERTIDMNDRALRHIVIGLGGKANGVPRESGFVITAASETMAILCMAGSRADLKRRLCEIVIGYNLDGEPVKARDLKACGAMMVLLNEAIMPNLVQTTEHTPAIIHGGPFANIAHGTNSVIADKIALKLADYVVVETGFGSDLGAEKFFDIVAQIHRLKPDAAVIVVSAKAIRYHGGIKSQDDFSVEKFKKGLENLEFHVKNVRKFGVPVVVSINKFATDSEIEIELIKEKCAEIGVECSVTEFFNRGGEGGIELAEKIVKITETVPSDFKPLYRLSVPLIEKIKLIATEVYGADDVYIERKAMKKFEKYIEHGYEHLPVCIAKTPNSISDNPKLIGVPKGWTLTVTDARLFAGAGFIVAICGDIMLMPGLSKNPAAFNMDVDEYGNIIGILKHRN